MRDAGGWDAGSDGGVVCAGTTGADGFTSAGDFAAAGKTGFCSTGAGGTGSFCAGGAAGTLGIGGGKKGERPFGLFVVCCGPRCFSWGGDDIRAGRFSGSGISPPYPRNGRFFS